MSNPLAMNADLARESQAKAQTRRRAAAYLTVFAALVIGYFFLRETDWQGSTALHTLMEALASLLAFTVGVMALVRYYSKKSNTFLFIGTGFLGTGLLDGYHAVVTSSVFAASFPSVPSSLIPWSWIASRWFLSVLMFLSWWAWRREGRLGDRGRISERAVYVAVAGLTVAGFLFFALVPLGRAYFPEIVFHRPEEFLPASFFLLALAGYLHKGYWKQDAFEHWLILSLIVGFIGQAMFMALSGQLFDLEFDAAHLLKKVGYILVLIGLLISMAQLFRQAEESGARLAKANAGLAQEIGERRRAEEALREQARRDPLTGVLNHGAIVDDLRNLLAEGDGGAPHAVAMVDVDGLKAINDTYGHQLGDAVLVMVARALSKDDAIIGRYGGDEFVAIIPRADRAAAGRYRDAVLDELARASLTDPETGASVPVAASIGLAIYPEDGRTTHELLDLSDSAMYASRRQRPVGPGELSPSRTLGGERAAAMVGQIVSLLTASGTIEDKLRLVAHRLSVGAGYDAVNVDVFAHSYGLPTARNTFSRVPDELVDAWQSEQRRMEDQPILRHIKSTRRALIVENPQNDERLTEGQLAVLRAAELRSAVVVPLFWEDDMIGSLSVASKRTDAFTAEDIEFLTAVATQITSVVRMTTLFDDLQSTSHNLSRAREDAVLLLAAASEAHDTTTGQHLRAVRGLTEALALDLSYDEASARELGMAAVLHDIGKIRVPDHVLSRPGKLTRKQWQVLIQHTVWGAEFLKSHGGFELAATVARSHHERWDGTGYPDALSGDDIPEGATIVAVADAIDAITSDRPYKDRRPIDEAVQEIRAFSGKQFSPRVVAALSRLYEKGTLAGQKWLANTEQAA